MADVALPRRAHARVLDPDEHPAVHRGTGVRAKTMGVALKKAYAFFFDQELGGVAAVLRHLVPVSDVETADTNKIVGKAAGKFVARNVQLEKPKGLFVVKRNLEVIGDDHELIGWIVAAVGHGLAA